MLLFVTAFNGGLVFPWNGLVQICTFLPHVPLPSKVDNTLQPKNFVIWQIYPIPENASCNARAKSESHYYPACCKVRTHTLSEKEFCIFFIIYI